MIGEKMLHVFTLITMLFSCSEQTSIPDTSSLQTLIHDGVSRQYGMFIPESYDAETALPLVINLHGGCMDAASQMAEMNPSHVQ